MDKIDNGPLVVEEGGQTVRKTGAWREGRANAETMRREDECRCDMGSVAGGNWEDPQDIEQELKRGR